MSGAAIFAASRDGRHYRFGIGVVVSIIARSRAVYQSLSGSSACIG